MNGNQLRRKLKGVKVCGLDQLPKKGGGYVIANTEPSYMRGSHWVCLYTPRRGMPEYFDSSGNMPLPQMEVYLTRYAPKYKKNTRRVQDYGTDTCGEFCVYYVKKRREGWSFKKIMDSFSEDLLFNEVLVSLYID